MDQSETYKYLGMEEEEGLQHHQMKGKIQKEYQRRLDLILKSELNARNNSNQHPSEILYRHENFLCCCPLLLIPVCSAMTEFRAHKPLGQSVLPTEKQNILPLVL